MRRIEIFTKSSYPDPLGEKLKQRINKESKFTLKNLRTANIYKMADDFLPSQSPENLRQLGQELFADPVLSQCCVNGELLREPDFDWYVEVGFKRGVTDSLGRTAQENLCWRCNIPTPPIQSVFSTQGYFLFLSNELDKDEILYLAENWMANPLVHDVDPLSKQEIEFINDYLAKTEYKNITHDKIFVDLPSQFFSLPQVELSAPSIKLHLLDVTNPQPLSEDILLFLSRDRTLALSEEELKALVNHFISPKIQEQRKKIGSEEFFTNVKLEECITDVELEVLAQTWSEHCLHKIFKARIHYQEGSEKPSCINSLFDTYIKGATQAIRKKLGQRDHCLSVFVDNAGVMLLDDNWGLAVKVETHNTPSALDPYGGALTGILGVNRDAFGTGRGGKLIFNTDVFCLAPPDDDPPIGSDLLAPSRIMEGVIRGVEHGGNVSGVPTVNGSLCFDARFMAKPLVFCGSGALIPRQLGGRPGHEKWVAVGDLVVMCGGRIGRDGIHGATISSQELKRDIPLGVVQIGDPITQKKLFDFLLLARDRGLFNAITDNGAGGLSSSVGEMAIMSGGAKLHLERAPLKYKGLQPWEILLSESQERMTLAVPPAQEKELLQLAAEMQVECTVLGEFTDSGQFVIYHKGKIAGYLDMDFLHHGTPQMELKAEWKAPVYHPEFSSKPAPAGDLTAWLLRVLGRLNVCSKESIVRQYDHEVQGCSVIKPLCGEGQDGPSDAAVLRTSPDSPAGIAIAHGICPRYADWDTYNMAACAMDEAVRSLVAVGADPSHAAALDNFCWCDPLPSASNPDASYKTAQLVRAARALYDTACAYQIPFISGKDSMKNDFVMGNFRLSIPPTVLVTAVAVVPEVQRAISMDVKKPGDLVYIIGRSRGEMGGSEFLAEFLPAKHTEKNLSSADSHPPKLYGHPPKTYPEEHLKIYQKMYNAIQKGWICSAHDCSDGGAAVALAESAFAGGYGMRLQLKAWIKKEKLPLAQLLFSESPGRLIVTIRPQHQKSFEEKFAETSYCLLGKVTEDQNFTALNEKSTSLNTTLETLKKTWQEPLKHSPP